MTADVDLDFGNRNTILDLIKHIPARRESKGKGSKHISGVYVQPIPIDPALNIATVPFKDADARGYFKLDFLNVSLYNKIRDQKHYDELMAMETPWHRFKEEEFVKQVSHISNYYEEIARDMPDSIPRLAMFNAAIRPSKRHLLGKPWNEMAVTIWDQPDDGGYAFKKSHAVAYSMLITLHMKIIDEESRSTSK